MKETVAAIICNWNKVEEPLQCIQSLQGFNLDIILIDNGSDPTLRIALKKQLPPHVHLIENKENLGGSGGFNTGIRFALEQQKYTSLWLLDNDVVVDKGALDPLIAALREDPQRAVVGSLILSFDHPDTVQELGAFIDRINLQPKLNLAGMETDAATHRVENVDYVPACSLLADVEKIREVGLLDEGYFLYWDDIDWARRFVEKGYTIQAASESHVWHKKGDLNKKSNNPTYYAWRNSIYFFLQHYKKDRKEVLQRIAEKGARSLVAARHTGKSNAFFAIASAIIDAFNGVRGKLAKERTFPLDSGLGIWDTTALKELQIVADRLERWNVLADFLGKQQLKTPIQLYTTTPDLKLPEQIEKRVKILPLESFKESGAPILLLSRHIFSEPNPFEKNISGEDILFLDQYTNLIRGKKNMERARQEWVEINALAVSIASKMV